MKIFIAVALCVTFVYAQNSDTACADQPNGKLVAVPNEPSKFYHCDNCIGVLKSCAANTIFSAEKQECVWADGCGGAGSGSGSTTPKPPPITPPPITPPPGPECPDLCPNGIYRPNPDDDSSYIVCDNGVDIIMQCPAGLIWNNDLRTCDWKDGGCGTGGVGGCTGCGSGGSGSGGSSGCTGRK